MEWIEINEDEMPIEGEPVNIMEGLKVLENYSLVWDNDVNFHFESINSGHVVAGESVTYWCYS